MASPYPSRAALAAGVPARYHYWHGRSRQRYLFTCTDSAGISDFLEGVAIAAIDGTVVWTGEVSQLALMAVTTWPRRAALYVHLLASTPEERRAVIEDLRPSVGGHLRLAA